MLTSDQIERLTLEVMLGKSSGITGKSADVFREALKKDLDFAKANGYQIELPFDPGA